MSVSLACSESDHAGCARPSCTCWCEHPDRAARQAREADLLARPAPGTTVRTETAPKSVSPQVRPRVQRDKKLVTRPVAKRPAARARKVAAPRPAPVPRTKDLPTAEIIAAYLAGEGTKRIGDRLGVAGGTILRRLRDAGIPIRRRGDRSIMLPDEVLVARYAAGESLDSIAATYSVNATTIANHLRCRGVTIRAGLRVELPVREVALRYGLGWSIEDLARSYGCSPQTISRRLVDGGVEIRPVGRPRRGA